MTTTMKCHNPHCCCSYTSLEKMYTTEDGAFCDADCYAEFRTMNTTTTTPKYEVHSRWGTLSTNSDWYAKATDVDLRGRGIFTIDRWSEAIEDYVEVRRVP